MSDPATRVLIIDDTEANRYALRRFIEQAGHDSLEAESGAEGIKLADREHPDVIVLDVNLPDMDGFVTCGRLKSNPNTADIPVIQVSASFIGARDRVKGLEGGADAYLTQPVEPIVLLATIDAVLRAHRVERELRRVQLQLRSALDAAGMETFLIEWQTQQMSRFVEPTRQAQSLRNCSMSVDEFVASVHADDRETLRQKMADSIVRQGPYEAEYRLKTDGRISWRLERGHAVSDKHGTPVQLIGVSLDITDRKSMTEALLQADQRKDEFLAMLAHELRNPLAPIRNAALVLDQMPNTNEAGKSMIGMIHRQVNQMTRLVDDLLDVSRITRGKIELKMTPLLLSEVIEYAVETTRPLVDSRRHDLIVAVPPEPMWINGDFARLGQALSNILSNAAKYTEPHGRIELAMRSENNEAVISIKDNGIGMPAELVPNVFELFMQGDRALDRSQGGLGIGLALVRSLISFHHGSVSAQSEGPGRGSEFIVRLPLMEPARRDAAPTAPRVHESGPRRVLIVDDNRDSADSMAMLLRVANHDVHVAHTGPDAVAMANGLNPEVVFLDIGLPGMSGLEVVRRLREMPATAAAKIIAITGYGQPDDKRRSLEAGFDQHWVKPIDPQAMQRILEI